MKRWTLASGSFAVGSVGERGLVGTTGDPLASTYYVMAASFVMLLAMLGIRNVDDGVRTWPPPVDREV